MNWFLFLNENIFTLNIVFNKIINVLLKNKSNSRNFIIKTLYFFLYIFSNGYLLTREDNLLI